MENGSTWIADRLATSTLRLDDAPLSDEAIVARVIGGEADLFELIMRRYNQRLYRAARALTKDEAEPRTSSSRHTSTLTLTWRNSPAVHRLRSG